MATEPDHYAPAGEGDNGFTLQTAKRLLLGNRFTGEQGLAQKFARLEASMTEVRDILRSLQDSRQFRVTVFTILAASLPGTLGLVLQILDRLTRAGTP